MSEKKPIQTDLVEDKLVVWDPKSGSEIYKLGYYGKPVGIPKPKTFDFDTPLNIDLIEGLYLLEKGLIEVVSGPSEKKINARALRGFARKAYEGFDHKYLVYRDLREHGYVVLTGIKFGCEFAVYEHGPGVDHAPYLVTVKASDEEISSIDVVRAGRLATTVKKRFIIAIPNLINKKVQYLMFKWQKL